MRYQKRLSYACILTVCTNDIFYSVPTSVVSRSYKIADFKTLKIKHCACHTLPQVLVLHGLFPTAPDQIRMAVSVELLDFYSALFERSCDAVNAMAAALNTFYNRRGLFLVNSKVRVVANSYV